MDTKWSGILVRIIGYLPIFLLTGIIVGMGYMRYPTAIIAIIWISKSAITIQPTSKGYLQRFIWNCIDVLQQ